MVLCVMYSISASAQYYKERGLVRDGNDLFERRNFRSSLNRYNEALEHDSTSYEALYNRANAYHHTRQTTPEDSTYTAETTFRNYEQIAADSLLSTEQRAEVLRNLGESLFVEERYEAALNAFRESLLLNPDDRETKYDYVLAKRIVDQKRSAQQQQQNQDQQNQDQNQQNQNQQQNPEDQQPTEGEGDNGDKPEQPNEPEGDKPNEPEQPEGEGENEPGGENEPEGENESDGDGEDEAPAPRPEELSSEKEAMLNAIQAEEDKTQDKLKEGQKAIIVRGKKNW